MPEDITLSTGHTVKFKTAEELSNREVKVLRRAARKVGLVGQKLRDLGLEEAQSDEDDDEATSNIKSINILSQLSDSEDDSLDLFQRECVVVRLLEWSLERPLPASADDVDDLPRSIYEAITTEAVKFDLSGGFEKTLETIQDPKADTAA